MNRQLKKATKNRIESTTCYIKRCEAVGRTGSRETRAAAAKKTKSKSGVQADCIGSEKNEKEE